jgi:hypothetical protein
VERQGLRSCHELGGENHIDLFLACLHPNEGGYGILEARGVLGEQRRQQFHDQVATTLGQIADSVRSQAGQVSLLATSEYFWFLHSEFHFLRLKQLFDSADLTLKRVIVYFRHQADLLSSALSTMVRDGFVVNEINSNMLNLHQFQYLKYQERLQNWISNFPGVKIDAYLYNQHRRDLSSHFMNALGIGSFDMPNADYLNRSLNDFGIDLLYYLNASQVGSLSSPGEMTRISESQCDSQDRKRLLSLVDRFFVGQPTINSDTVAAIDAYFAAENKALFKSFMLQADTSLFLLKRSEIAKPLDRSTYPPELVVAAAGLLGELMKDNF